MFDVKVNENFNRSVQGLFLHDIVRALGNGPFLWASWRGKLDPEMEFDRKTGTKWPTLAQWSLGRELNLDPEELESKIRTMLPELSCVEILVQTASDEDNGNGSESLAASLLIP